ncbi:Na+/H+ antiporter subunit E [Nocardioides sp. JQ2195]|uniref:Na+/H+ antiporter subunit E n=1 Tax=Nocardioides sp. JQ2195 TaxID=2592334 RepID=UPI00143ECBD4|nr:Na+/H+ antiporter subunit E [Nocardioides sp. JQ2195]QIX25330.1 Na+/H+ antiporter subunit E [Nocardioides sp. JQ2195]
MSPHQPRHRLLQLPVLAWLTLVWLMLWRDFSLGNALFGFIVAVIVCVVFPLPRLRMNLHVRPIPLLWLVVKFLADVVVSSLQVAVATLRSTKNLRNAVIEVDLRSSSDFVLTVVAEMTCLIPGSLAVEARRSTHTLFFHAFDVKDVDGVEKFRQRVLDQERRVVRAFGAELSCVEDPPRTTAATEGVDR